MPSMLSHTLPFSQALLVEQVKQYPENQRMASELWQRIRAVRKHLQLSQESFGDIFGVSKAAVSQWESATLKGRTRPGLDTLRKMSDHSGAPMDWLISDESDCDYEFWAEDNVVALSSKATEIAAPPEQAKPVSTQQRFSFAMDDQDERPMRFFQMAEMAVEDTMQRCLYRGWSISAQTRFADFAVFGPDKLHALVEVKLMRQLDGRTLPGDIEKLIGGLWRTKNMGKINLDPAVLAAPLFLVLVVTSPRFDQFVEEIRWDLWDALQTMESSKLIEGFAVVSVKRTEDNNGVELFDEVRMPQNMRVTLMNLSRRISVPNPYG